jgi:L-cysteate sulfo-lyase
MKLSALPRFRLANLPTPLQELPNLSRAVNGPRILVKRDDMTGLAFGGNKTRKLEYLMAKALEYKADYIVTGAGFHSNWCTQTAAAARRLDMKVVLIKSGPKEGYDPEEYDGNHLLHFLQGAEIKVVRPEDGERAEQETMEELKAKGHKPYLLTATGSTPPGAAGYMNAMLELLGQAVASGIDIDYLVHATGSGGTQAGLIIGAKAFNTNVKVIGATTGSRSRDEQFEKVSDIIDGSLKLLDLDLRITEGDIIIYDQYAGDGYGFMTHGKAEAIQMVAETEGLFLDPVYTGSAMACLIDLCRGGFFKRDDVVVFLHTGGAAALFPYKTPIKAYASGEAPPWTIPPWSPFAI